MANEFTPDGHKYGWHFLSGWGIVGYYGNKAIGFGFNKVSFVVSIRGGGLRTLGLDGWGRADNANTPRLALVQEGDRYVDSFYFRLAYDLETGAACAYNDSFIESICEQPLSANQFLARCTISTSDPSGLSKSSLACLFSSTQNLTLNTRHAGGDMWDFSFEFDKRNSPAVKSLSISSLHTGQSNGAHVRVSAAHDFNLYLGDYERQFTYSPNTYTITNFLPLGLSYKHTNCAVYMLEHGVAKEEFEALAARVTALEEGAAAAQSGA